MTTVATRIPLDAHLAPSGARDLDAGDLAAELRRKIQGEVRFDDGSRALYATDGSNYRQVPIGVVIPREQGGRGRDRRRLPAISARRSSGAAAAPAWPASAATSPSSWTSPSTCTASSASTPSASSAPCEPGCVLDDLRDAAERARPHVRSRPGDAQPLHAGRNARQRFLRHRTRCWVPSTAAACAPPTTPTSWKSSPTTAYDSASAPRRPRSWSASSRPAAGAGDIYAQAQGLRGEIRRRHPPGLPQAAAARVRLQPSPSCCRRTASTSPAPWSARKARWSRSSKRR